MFTIIGGDGKEYGPVTTEQLRSWVAAGRANLDTKARAVGSEEWRRLGDFPEFSGSVATPPVMAPPPTTFGAGAPVVVVDANLASLGQRFSGALIDGILKMLCLLPAFSKFRTAVGEQVSSGQQPDVREMVEVMSAAVISALPILLVLVVVQAVLLSTRGQSIGKMLVGTRIVRHVDGAKAGFMHAFLLRSVIPTIIEQLPILGALFWIADVCFIFTEPRRCIHDLIAGTKVVKA